MWEQGKAPPPTTTHAHTRTPSRTCRYSPNLSRSVTHLVVHPTHDSQKLRAVRSARALWPQDVVTAEWLVQSREAGTLQDAAAFRVLPPVR